MGFKGLLGFTGFRGFEGFKGFKGVRGFRVSLGFGASALEFQVFQHPESHPLQSHSLQSPNATRHTRTCKE